MSSSSQVPESWISAFCALVGHEYFAEVSEDFIEDDFNLTGLQSQVPMYKEALEMILDVEPEDVSEEEEEEEEDEDEDDDDDEMNGGAAGRGYRRAEAAADRRHARMESDLSMIEGSAELLYGLIHQRFITSRPGIQQMAEKYDLGHFGHCPRVFCHGAKVLPVGCSDIPGQETVKLFCPSCLDVYSPPNSRFQGVDGAFFGTTFGCLFFMTFPDLEVGGQRPAYHIDGSTASPHPNQTQDKTARSSLSSSLTSQQPGIPPSASENNNAAHHDPNSPNWPGNSWPPKQPEIINGVTPKNLAPGLGPGSIYEPRIYGFRVSELAKTGPRMKWLRSRPQDINELDECRIFARSQEMALRSQAIATGGSSATQQQQQQQQNASLGGDTEMADEEEDEEIGDAEMVEETAAAGRGIDVPGAAAAQKRKSATERGKQRMHNDVGTNGGTSLVNGDSRGGAVRVGDGG